MGPIHFAAKEGNVGIINALVDEYEVDPNSKVSSYVLVYTFMFTCIAVYNEQL